MKDENRNQDQSANKKEIAALDFFPTYENSHTAPHDLSEAPRASAQGHPGEGE
jgi:hypothetical protein